MAIKTVPDIKLLFETGDIPTGSDFADLIDTLAYLPDITILNQSITGKVDKVSGYGLSKNDYSDTEKTTVANNLSAIQSLTTNKQDNLGFTPENSANKDQTNGYAGLDSAGKINPLQLPALAITDTFTVSTSAAMLALTAQTGDVCIRTDLSESFILSGDPTVLSNWHLLLSPTAPVSSIFGRSGSVTAQSGDYTAAQVGAISTSATGVANGVATLGSDGKVPSSQLPTATYPVNSVFGRTGTVSASAGDYTATQVGAISTSATGVANGVATLDSNAKLPQSQLPTMMMETKTAPTISSGTLTINCANGNVFSVALTASVTTLTFSNAPAAGNAYGVTVAFTMDGTARTIAWGSSVKWAGGTAPTLTSTNAKVDIFVFVTWDGGTTWYGHVAGQNF